MEDYPEELRTPPVALAAMVGCPELHAEVSAHLHAEQPPINTLALPDFSKISLIAKTPKEATDSGQSTGILKRDWLLKHRTRVPAVVAALFKSDHVSGDPAQWLQVCTDLENLKAVIRGRNIKLVLVVVVESTSKEDISEDRMIALRKRAEVDSKYLIVFEPKNVLEQQQSLNRLGSTFAELANIYYRDEGRKVKTRLERKSISSVELSIRYCFKVAVYAEFRRDWVEALRLYEDAYHTLRETIGTSTRLPPIQRLVEIKTVAEQLNFKISTLLLHGGKIIEAITWFKQHNDSYKKLVGAPEVNFLHWEWLSRQFLVFAELLETSSAAIESTSSPILGATDKLSEWEFSSSYYFQLAAHYLKEKRSCLELTLSMSETANDVDGNGESVAPSVYVGQFARLLEQGGTLAMQLLTDEEYVHYALAEGKRFQDSFEIIALLKRSFETFTKLNAQRMASYCGFEMAREYFAVNEFSNAKQHFDSIASLYRKEGWVTLLWEVLGYLQECSRRLGAVKDFVEYSLEMAALPVSSIGSVQSLSFKECGPAVPASLSQREIIHKEVFELVRGESGLASNEGNNDLKVTGDQPLHLEIDLVSPLRVVLLASVAFHEQIVKPGAPTLITLSLLSQLPCAVEIDQLEIQFNQSVCNFTIVNGQRPQLDATSNGQPGHRVETAPALMLSTNKWLRLTYDIKSDQSGKLECISVIARLGPYFTICCRAESPASMNDLPLWKFEDRVETLPTKDPGLAFSGQKATQIEELEPQVDLKLGASGPALVGESFVLPVTISAKGHAVHSGELKINLVDTRGGGLLSPREVEPSFTDNPYVELLCVSGLECEDDSQTGTDDIRKIQHSFGLISVPFLNDGDSWSCKLEIRWHRPKPVLLYVSLGYSPHSSELSAQKIHVHKSLEIEGKNAVVFSHQCMLPFRRDPLLLSKIKTGQDSDQVLSLPLNETSILIVSAKNSTELPLQLLAIFIELDDNDIGKSCTVRHGGEDHSDLALLMPGEEFKKVFSVIPEVNIPKLKMGTVCLRWRRDTGPEGQPSSSATASEVLTKYRLPDINVELSPLVVNLECPPQAILGNPFTYFVRIQNQTHLLQEIKFSLADSQSFVLSGPHNDMIFVLPKSEQILGYKLVPLASGSQQLPRVTVTSVRYSAGYQPPVSATTIFVFPSKPHFEMANMGMSRESIATE
ncbi:Trafficking protein particle complex subunit like [Actinidia chinensis var. chinensis]|uniref:Trafficking protein particle complex subunit 11 n=1 Tax=Actinidia chinensis var. chinensis TaxID=1590841 RepID=A0A2R6S2U6_ACTCC|nr:Trafficking protein particle complex subunit like [Actinidia chinensis var. chinensis]